MSVSRSHIFLVDCLEQYIKSEFDNKQNSIIYVDKPNSLFKDRIPFIGNAIPDLYARCYNPDIVIIGEAKTLNDVENPHSLQQYREYLSFCDKGNAKLVFAVPWTIVSLLKNTIRILKKKLNINNVDVIYLEQLPEEREICPR